MKQKKKKQIHQITGYNELIDAVFDVMQDNLPKGPSFGRRPDIEEKLSFVGDQKLIDRYERQKDEPPEVTDGLRFDYYDFTRYCKEQRKKATKSHLQEMQQRYAKLYSGREFVLEYTMANDTIGRGGYNTVDKNHFLTFAAAVWILDQLTIQDKLWEAYKYLPLPAQNDHKVYIPNIEHPSYNHFLVHSMVHLILHRDDHRLKPGGTHGSLVNEVLCDPQPIPEGAFDYRQSFDAVIKILDKEAIKRATDAYTKKMDDIYRFGFTVSRIIKDRKKELEKELNHIERQIDKIRKQNQINYEQVGLRVLSNQKQTTTSCSPDVINISSQNNTELDSLLQQHQLLVKKYNELDVRTGATYCPLILVNDKEKFLKEIADIIPEELSKEICSFSVVDPFEASFALLYLLDSGSDIPWNYYGGIGVAYTLEDQLPYDCCCEMDYNRQRLTKNNDLLYQHRFSGYRYPDFLDGTGEAVERTFGKNFSQVLLADTGVLLPMIDFQKDGDDIPEALDFTTEKEKALYSMLRNTLRSGRIISMDPALYHFLYDEDEDTAEEDEEDPTEQIAELKKALSEKTKALKSLQAQWHTQQTEINELNYKLETLQEENRLAVGELADLRELVYIQDNDIQLTEKQNGDEISFPFHTEKHVVSFGGHTSWLKSIKTMLPDVKFIAPETIPNIDLIRHADEVWIQPNCISHAAYYRIIDTVRYAKKTIRYFHYSSPEKCAIQFVKTQ